MATKLTQLLAIEKDVKARNERELTDLYKKIQKEELFSGRVVSYTPHDENGDKEPNKEQQVQVRASEVVDGIVRSRTRLYDIVATKDKTNITTAADVVVEKPSGEKVTIFAGMPVSFLLYMEKQLVDLETVVGKIPVLPTDKVWSWDPNQNMYVTLPVVTYKTAKIPQNHIKYEATKEHPAQVEMYYVDKQIGAYTTLHQAGAMPAQRKAQILERIGRLKDAVKFAREEANNVTVVDVSVGKRMFEYLFE
jgi:hypothetical protein